MAEYINKEDLKFLEIPIAPVLQGEQVHYEQGFLREWLENVPAADVVEREKINKAIEEMENEVKFWDYSTVGQEPLEVKRIKQAKVVSYRHAIEIIKRNIGDNNG